MKKALSEKVSVIAIIVGGLFLLWGFILFIIESKINFTSAIDPEKFAQFGDFVGGLIGSIWALAGVILFYVALSEQRKDFATNRSVLNAQTDALKQQIKEFELQREELSQTRKVFRVQSNTLKLQQFESTLFNLINLHHGIVNSIDVDKYEKNKGATIQEKMMGHDEERRIISGRDCFSLFSDILKKNFELLKDRFTEFTDNELIDWSYSTLYKEYQADLGHYFRNLYHIFKFIDNSEIEDKSKYTSLVRAQLSNSELVILFYNSLTKFGELKFKPLIEKYKILKNINLETLIDEEKHTVYYESLKSKI